MSDVFCKACKDHDMCAHLGKCWISREALDVPSPYIAELTALRARLAEVEGALRDILAIPNSEAAQGIMKVIAKAALASAGEEAGMKCAVCRGSGVDPNYVLRCNCRYCGGTGDAHMPTPITPTPTGEAQDDE